MQGLRRALPDGDLSVWWATLTAAESRRCDLAVEGWTGPRPPHLRLGAAALVGRRHEIVLRQGQSCLTLTGGGSFDQVVLRNRTPHVADVEVLPKDFALPADAITIDTDHPVAESERKGRVQEKVAAVGGTAYCQIDGPVQWAEWAFEVPAAGRYELFLRGAGEHPVVLRELRFDGQTFPAVGVAVRLPGRGGWCRTADDWAWFRVRDQAQQPANVTLAAGRHVLRLDYIQGSQNLDALVLQPLP
jgi:hypothetical protein